MLHILIVDDNAAFREVFSRWLDHRPDFEVVGQAGSLAEARARLEVLPRRWVVEGTISWLSQTAARAGTVSDYEPLVKRLAPLRWVA